MALMVVMMVVVAVTAALMVVVLGRRCTRRQTPRRLSPAWSPTSSQVHAPARGRVT